MLSPKLTVTNIHPISRAWNCFFLTAESSNSTSWCIGSLSCEIHAHGKSFLSWSWRFSCWGCFFIIPLVYHYSILIDVQSPKISINQHKFNQNRWLSIPFGSWLFPKKHQVSYSPREPHTWLAPACGASKPDVAHDGSMALIWADSDHLKGKPMGILGGKLEVFRHLVTLRNGWTAIFCSRDAIKCSKIKPKSKSSMCCILTLAALLANFPKGIISGLAGSEARQANP